MKGMKHRMKLIVNCGNYISGNLRPNVNINWLKLKVILLKHHLHSFGLMENKV